MLFSFLRGPQVIVEVAMVICNMQIIAIAKVPSLHIYGL